MDSDREFTRSEPVTIDDLHTDFLSLRIGEEIPKLEIVKIKKITNKSKEDNLAGVDYKYIIETRDGKVLMVNSWVLWKKIASMLQQAGQTEVTLYLKHTGIQDYSVKLISAVKGRVAEGKEEMTT